MARVNSARGLLDRQATDLNGVVAISHDCEIETKRSAGPISRPRGVRNNYYVAGSINRIIHRGSHRAAHERRTGIGTNYKLMPLRIYAPLEIIGVRCALQQTRFGDSTARCD